MTAIDAVNERHGRFSAITAAQRFDRKRRARADSEAPAWTRRLAYLTSYKLSMIDSILRRACADGYIDSATYRTSGWNDATEKLREELRLINGQPDARGEELDHGPL